MSANSSGKVKRIHAPLSVESGKAETQRAQLHPLKVSIFQAFYFHMLQARTRRPSSARTSGGGELARLLLLVGGRFGLAEPLRHQRNAIALHWIKSI